MKLENTGHEGTEQKENRVKIDMATKTGGIVAISEKAEKTRHALESFAGLVGYKVPEKMARKVTDKRYRYHAKDLISMGLEIENSPEKIKELDLHEFEGVVDPELMTLTLIEYLSKRTSYTARRVEHDDVVDCQIIKRPEMTITATREYAKDNWVGQYSFFGTTAETVSRKLSTLEDGNGQLYLLAIGAKKAMIVKMQEFAEKKEVK